MLISRLQRQFLGYVCRLSDAPLERSAETTLRKRMDSFVSDTVGPGYCGFFAANFKRVAMQRGMFGIGRKLCGLEVDLDSDRFGTRFLRQERVETRDPLVQTTSEGIGGETCGLLQGAQQRRFSGAVCADQQDDRWQSDVGTSFAFPKTRQIRHRFWDAKIEFQAVADRSEISDVNSVDHFV